MKTAANSSRDKTRNINGWTGSAPTIPEDSRLNSSTSNRLRNSNKGKTSNSKSGRKSISPRNESSDLQSKTCRDLAFGRAHPELCPQLKSNPETRRGTANAESRLLAGLSRLLEWRAAAEVGEHGQQFPAGFQFGQKCVE